MDAIVWVIKKLHVFFLVTLIFTSKHASSDFFV
jgi:hypothetical protein